MKYDPTLHHRRSIRLRGYDYSREGAYFITICTYQRRCIFGYIENQEMMLNEYGRVAYQEWEKLPERWPHIQSGAFQIMPNHLHGIIIIHDHVGEPLAGAQRADIQPTSARLADGATHDGLPDDGSPVERAPDDGSPVERAPARGAPTCTQPAPGDDFIVDDPIEHGTKVSANDSPVTPTERRDTQIQWAHKPTVGQIVGAYQSCVSTTCLKVAKSQQPAVLLGKLWQRNFWEHIIRTVDAFDHISHYIISNPENWETDGFYNNR